MTTLYALYCRHLFTPLQLPCFILPVIYPSLPPSLSHTHSFFLSLSLSLTHISPCLPLCLGISVSLSLSLSIPHIRMYSAPIVASKTSHGVVIHSAAYLVEDVVISLVQALQHDPTFLKQIVDDLAALV